MNKKQNGISLIELLLVLGVVATLLIASFVITGSINQTSLIKTYLADVQLGNQKYFTKNGDAFISKDKQIVKDICWASQNLRNNVFRDAGYEILGVVKNNEKVLISKNTCEHIDLFTSVMVIKNLNFNSNAMTGNLDLSGSEKTPENIWKSTDKL